MKKCFKCGKQYKFQHTCNKQAPKHLFDVNDIHEFFDKLIKYFDKKGIIIEFQDFPSEFSNKVQIDYNKSGPGWKGGFRGIITVKNPEYGKIGLGDIFGWYSAFIPEIETGSGTSGADFSMSGSRIPLSLFPKLYKRWELKGNLAIQYKDEYKENISEIMDTYINERDDYVRYSKEVKEIENKIREVKKLQDELDKLLKLTIDNKEKEFYENNKFEVPSLDQIDADTYKQMMKYTHKVPKMENEKIRKLIDNADESLKRYLDYIETHPYVFI